MAVSPELASAAMTAVRDCMGVQPGEKVLVVTDEPLRNIAHAIHAAARELGDEVLKKIAFELTEKLRSSTSVDWQKRESVRARLRNLVRIAEQAKAA